LQYVGSTLVEGPSGVRRTSKLLRKIVEHGEVVEFEEIVRRLATALDGNTGEHWRRVVGGGSVGASGQKVRRGV